MPGRPTSSSWGSESALIVKSPVAEEIAGVWRRRLERTSAGVPAHVTVLYPFRAVGDLSSADMHRLGALFAQSHPIEFRLARLDWFGSRVLYISLEPEEPFRHMTEAVAAAFPECPPYRNAFTSIIPHITVGEEAAAWRMRRAARRLAPLLPLSDVASDITLIAPYRSRWEVVERFPLG